MPSHNIIEAVLAVLEGYCSLHEENPELCGAVEDAQKYAKIVGSFAGLVIIAARLFSADK